MNTLMIIILDIANIGIGVFNYILHKRGSNPHIRKLHLVAAVFCSLLGGMGLILNLFRLAISINGTI